MIENRGLWVVEILIIVKIFERPHSLENFSQQHPHHPYEVQLCPHRTQYSSYLWHYRDSSDSCLIESCGSIFCFPGNSPECLYTRSADIGHHGNLFHSCDWGLCV